MAGWSSRPDHVENLRRAHRAARASRPHRQQRRAPEPRVAEHCREREQPGAADIVSAAGAWPTSRPARFRCHRPRSRISIRRHRAGSDGCAIGIARIAKSICPCRQSLRRRGRILAQVTSLHRDQPIPRVDTVGERTGLTDRTEGRWTSSGFLSSTSCGILATAAAMALLRPANPDSNRDELCSASPMTRRLCRGRRPGRPTVSGWSTRATAREMPTSGNSVWAIPTQSADDVTRPTSRNHSGLPMDDQSYSARSEMAVVCTSFRRPAVSNASSPASATSQPGRRTDR